MYICALKFHISIDVSAKAYVKFTPFPFHCEIMNYGNKFIMYNIIKAAYEDFRHYRNDGDRVHHWRYSHFC